MEARQGLDSPCVYQTLLMLARSLSLSLSLSLADERPSVSKTGLNAAPLCPADGEMIVSAACSHGLTWTVYSCLRPPPPRIRKSPEVSTANLQGLGAEVWGGTEGPRALASVGRWRWREGGSLISPSSRGGGWGGVIYPSEALRAASLRGSRTHGPLKGTGYYRIQRSMRCRASSLAGESLLVGATG